MYSNNEQPWMGCVDGNWYVRPGPGLCCNNFASRVGDRTMIADEQTSMVRVRSGQRGGQQARQGREKRMCLGDRGREWAPCGIVQVGGCHSGDVFGGGGSRRRDLALWMSRNILCTSEEGVGDR
jgi:hypothetical protein